MADPLNRKARKAMQANARALSVPLSKTAMDYDLSGRLVRVTDPVAQAVLARAFERLLRAGGDPQVLRVSDREAAAFPRGGQPPAPEATAWLGVGIDRVGMATYALRWLRLPGVRPIEDRAAADSLLRAMLSVECASPGFPVAGHA